MILRAQRSGWQGIEPRGYKDQPGEYAAITRHTLFGNDVSKFEVRFFEIGAGGFSSHEKHQHEHCVFIVRGNGKVLLHEEWHDIGPGDVVIVESGTPHQFRSVDQEGMGFLCIVDRLRDKPVSLANSVQSGASG